MQETLDSLVRDVICQVLEEYKVPKKTVNMILVLDKVMNKAAEGRKRGIQWRMMEGLEDLDFADILLVQRWSDTKTKLKKLDKEPAKVGFKIN